MDIEIQKYKLKNLTKYNIILGKNGCGKSTVLRVLDIANQTWTHKKYISPERGGLPAYDPNIDNTISQHANWLNESRRKNFDDQFRQKSMALLKSLELLVNRRIISDEKRRRETNESFDDTLAIINQLLDNVKLVQGEKNIPDIVDSIDQSPRSSDVLSSGEKELLCLAIEFVSFAYEFENSNKEDKVGILLLDEPDVHLHPDLQYRLISTLIRVLQGLDISVIISTHSTAILGALSDQKTNVCFMSKGMTDLNFKEIDNTTKDILPIFGAHPLSNIFNQRPILLVEGEDDERIWQQAIRSSQGRIRLWPCQTGSIDNLEQYENAASDLINAIYDNSKAYSLRDRDNNPYPIDDKTNVVRFRLNCYAVENLLLSDDVLNSLGSTWEDLKSKILSWLDSNIAHPKYAELLEFSHSFDRRNLKVKGLEVTILYLLGKSKPWEIIIGQSIANLNSASSRNEYSLADFLGSKLVDTLGLCV